MTIGRVGLDVDLDNPDEWNHSGDRVSLSGDLQASSVAAAKALRQQLLGHLGTVQPVTWTEDTDADGFYRVRSVTVDTVPLSLVVGTFRFDIELERVPHYQTPGFNGRSTQPERNGSTVTHKPWIGIPSTRKGFDVGSDAVVYYYPRIGPGGTAHYLESGSYLDNDTFRGVIDPANWYDMSPKLQVGGYTQTGTQIPALANTSTPNWQLDNGLIKFEDTATSGCLFKVTFVDTSGTPSSWSGSTAYDVEVGYWDGTTWQKQTNLIGMRVLRNDAQEVGIELVLRIKHPLNAQTWEGTCTLRLRRGALFAECHITGGRAEKYGIHFKDLGSASCTAFTGNVGFYKTSNDGDGNQPLAMTFDSPATAVLVDAYAYLNTAGRRIVLGIGASAGSGASLPDRATDLLDQFGAAGAVTVNVGA